MSLIVGFPLHQFSVFKIRDTAGRPYVLTGGPGGQLLAQQYLAIEPQLKPLQPFTSADIDFKGGRNDVQRIISVWQGPFLSKLAA